MKQRNTNKRHRSALTHMHTQHRLHTAVQAQRPHQPLIIAASILLDQEVKIKEKTNIFVFNKEVFYFLEECKPRLSETKGSVVIVVIVFTCRTENAHKGHTSLTVPVAPMQLLTPRTRTVYLNAVLKVRESCTRATKRLTSAAPRKTCARY
jgi:hypothetical protein